MLAPLTFQCRSAPKGINVLLSTCVMLIVQGEALDVCSTLLLLLEFDYRASLSLSILCPNGNSQSLKLPSMNNFPIFAFRQICWFSIFFFCCFTSRDSPHFFKEFRKRIIIPISQFGLVFYHLFFLYTSKVHCISEVYYLLNMPR